jgi:hypothetical protein
MLLSDVVNSPTGRAGLPLEVSLALINLQGVGMKVIAVAIPSVGCCDCMLPTWPVETIIGENAVSHIDRKSDAPMATCCVTDPAEHAVNRGHLQHYKLQRYRWVCSAHAR